MSVTKILKRRHMFPRIYALEGNKICTVADKLQSSVALSLRRTVRRGVEAHQLDLLQKLIETHLDKEDIMGLDLIGEEACHVKSSQLLDELGSQ
ncbi:hypothetical protein Tco_1155807 [Tanacetum coccineum]